MISVPPPVATVGDLLAAARGHANGDPVAVARIAIAEAWDGPADHPDALARAEHALDLARASADPLAESAALDRMTSVHLMAGRLRAALASAVRRTEILAPLPVDAETSFELADALEMAADTAIAAGELHQAWRAATAIRDLPMHGEVGHVAAAQLVLVAALAGELAAASRHSATFRAGWERAGRPRIGTLRRCAWAAATAAGLRGEEDTRADWQAVADALTPAGTERIGVRGREFFDALLLLHRRQPTAAARVLAVRPDETEQFRLLDGLWRPWYAALWAEAAVLSARSDAAARVAVAVPLAADNPVAAALVARGDALLAGDPDGVLAAAAALHAAGCRYQWARSLLLAGEADQPRGLAAMKAIGASVQE